jgi:hypothetical protein
MHVIPRGCETLNANRYSLHQAAHILHALDYFQIKIAR